MANQYFNFKQFTVNQSLCAMKVGTDGVLLGAWVDITNTKTILDIGTGTGLISLMLAQRCDAQIDALDIDNDAIEQAKQNFEHSKWQNRLNALRFSLQEFVPKCTSKYDLIISNPPYFINSLKAPDKKRATARHANTLTYSELLSCSKRLLSTSGRICLILPNAEEKNILDIARSFGFFCKKRVYVISKPEKPPIRILLELSQTECECEVSNLCIETEERHEYSPEFIHLVKDFYLKI